MMWTELFPVPFRLVCAPDPADEETTGSTSNTATGGTGSGGTATDSGTRTGGTRMGGTTGGISTGTTTARTELYPSSCLDAQGMGIDEGDGVYTIQPGDKTEPYEVWST